MPDSPAPPADRELILTRDIDLPAASLYRAWTEPEILMRWFTPKPWKTVRAEMDVRAGGSSLVVMQSPEGDEFPNPGIYLEVVPNEKLVFTDAYIKAWEPSGKPFMTGVITFEDLGGNRTRYTARVLHWSVEDRKKHEEMGFHDGWNRATDQLVETASQL